MCAILELRQLGVSVPAERIEQAKLTERQKAITTAEGGIAYGTLWDESDALKGEYE